MTISKVSLSIVAPGIFGYANGKLPQINQLNLKYLITHWCLTNYLITSYFVLFCSLHMRLIKCNNTVAVKLRVNSNSF